MLHSPSLSPKRIVSRAENHVDDDLARSFSRYVWYLWKSKNFVSDEKRKEVSASTCWSQILAPQDASCVVLWTIHGWSNWVWIFYVFVSVFMKSWEKLSNNSGSEEFMYIDGQWSSRDVVKGWWLPSWTCRTLWYVKLWNYYSGTYFLAD